MTINNKIFNAGNVGNERIPLFLGENLGLFDTINKQYPEIWKLYLVMKSMDWDANEFDYSTCLTEFKTCDKSVYDIMIKTLAWQWEADSIAARSVAPVIACFNPCSELWAAWQLIGTNEVVHSAAYSEIVRSSFDDPSVIKNEILKVKESIARLETVAYVFGKAYTTGHKFALGLVENNQETYNDVFMFCVGLLVLERIQFMSSFSITFAICKTGAFGPIGNAVQKIAADELDVHVQLDKAVLRNELGTERGMIAFNQCKDLIQKLIDEVVESEFAFTDYAFSEGRELAGVTPEKIKQWILFCAKDVYTFFDLKSQHVLPTVNPLKYMETWLNISDTQKAPMEEDPNNYKVNILQRTDENKIFDVDF